MKKILNYALIALMVITAASCKKKDPVFAGQATVTFKPVIDGPYFLHVDDNTAFRVLNPDMQKYPFDKFEEKRAIIAYSFDSKSVAEPVPGYKTTQAVTIMAMDTLKIKQPVVFDPHAEYGNDKLGLYLSDFNFPTTLIEDGYLMAVMAIPYGMGGDQAPEHIINLLANVNPGDPYEVELRHNAQGNSGPYTFTGIICFPLGDILPDTEGATKTVTLKWNSVQSGMIESAKFDYKSK